MNRGFALLATYPVREGVCSCPEGPACQHPGKHPLKDVVPRGLNNATHDASVIRTWYNRFPDANPAVATGQPSGVFVLDVDAGKRGFESLDAVQQEYGPLPTTLTVNTPSGGLHLYFRYPGQQVRNSVSALGEGLDIRGDGGYVVAPGASTDKGEYQFVDPSVEIAEAPAWLVDWVTREHRSTRVFDLRTTLSGIPEGRRDIELFRTACFLRGNGMSIEVAEAIVTEAARNCTPPFDVEKAREKVRRAYAEYPVDRYPLTDVGNARRLVQVYGEDIRYSNSLGWLVWSGTRWQRDEAGEVTQHAIATVTAVYDEGRRLLVEANGAANRGGDREANALTRHAQNSQRAERIGAMLQLAKTEPGITVPEDAFDHYPMLFNCANGTLDLRTGELRQHDRADLLMKLSGTRYDPKAEAPVFTAFLERVQPDPEIRAFLKRAVGYSLTGLTTEQVMFFLYGKGANGKSKFVEAVQNIMGDYATVAPPGLLLATSHDPHPTGLADLRGARFVPTIETEDNRRLAEAQVKWMTGGDKLKARMMRQDFFEFEPQFKLWLASNHKPSIKDTSHGMWRRIHLVPFAVTIPEEEQDKKLPEKLAAAAAGILRWAVEGCLEWQRVGLQPPEAVKAATARYREDMDVLGQFMEDCTEEAFGARLPTSDLFAAYEGWCDANGERPLSQRGLTTKLDELDYTLDTGRANKRVWLDLKLSQEGLAYASKEYLHRIPGGDLTASFMQGDQRVG